MSIAAGNIFADIPGGLAAEQFTELVSKPHIRVERIVSTGQATPAGQFYDQGWAERVPPKSYSRASPSRGCSDQGVTFTLPRVSAIVLSGHRPTNLLGDSVN